MLVEDIIEREKIIGEIIQDFSIHNISNFGEWLAHYDDTLDEVEEFVNSYVDKVNTGRFDEIERFQKVVMMNALALFIVELELDHYELHDELVDKLLETYVKTIRNYNRMLKGEMKLIGPVFISDITSHKFVKTNDHTKH